MSVLRGTDHYVVQTMGKYMQREIDKRNNTDG